MTAEGAARILWPILAASGRWWRVSEIIDAVTAVDPELDGVAVGKIVWHMGHRHGTLTAHRQGDGWLYAVTASTLTPRCVRADAMKAALSGPLAVRPV